MRSVASFRPINLRLGFRTLLYSSLLCCFGFSSAVVAQDIIDPHLCAGDFGVTLGCTSNDIQINDVSQMTEAEGGSPPVATCIEGDMVTLDIKLTTLLNAQTRYDAVVWFGKEGNNPRAVGGGSCYASSFPDNPLSPYIESDPADTDSCFDVYDSKPNPVEQYYFDVEVECLDLVSPTPDPNDDFDAVVPTPDGQLDLFAVVTWGNAEGSIDCGLPSDNPAWNLEPGGPSKCDAALLLGINVEVLEAATIQVVKNSSGGEGAFDFTTDIPGLSPGFTLDTTGDGTESTAVIQLNEGEVGVTYNITETVPAGWSLASATCSNGDTPDAVTPLDTQNVVCTFNDAALGSVTVIKNTVGDNGSFDFTSDLPGGNFNIATAGNTGMYSESNVPAGTYSIVETVPAGWALSSATCSDGSPPNALVLSDGETVTCTFVDTKDGLIIVDKVTLPAESPQSFTFTPSWGAPFDLTDTDTPELSGNLTPGTYSVAETVPAGWVLSDVTCIGVADGREVDDIENPAAIDLDPGEVVTCVFTNTQDGSIWVVKSLSATGPAVEIFGFTSNFNGSFNLEGDLATTGPIPVTPGSGYTVSEDDPTADGWANTGASCSDGSDPLIDIVVSPGEAVVCTFTNTPLGSATIIKNTVGGDDTFDFIGDAPFNGLQLTTIAGTASEDFTYELLAGAYDVTEDPIPAGWVLTDVGCVEDGIQDSGAVNPTATLNVELAETVTCTFENTADGTLIIRKETLPDGAAQGFDFVGDAAGTIHDYSATAEEIVVSGQPGTYSSAETVPPGWELTDIDCVGQSDVSIGVGTDAFEPGDTNVTVDLEAGDTVICTFENTAAGSITIEKMTGGGENAFTFNTDFDGSFQLDTSGGNNPASQTFSNLLPGSYMISEVIPSNWALASISCSVDVASTITIGGDGGFDPGDTSVTIDLVGGEAITCRFTNAAYGHIIVDKVTDPPGSLQSFDFTSNYGVPFSLTDAEAPNDSGLIEPSWTGGLYNVAETVPAGWTLTDATCTDGEAVMTPDNITLPAGGTVTCTFTNTIQPGNIIVEKQTDPDGSSEDFGFTTSYGSPFSLTDGQTNNSGPLLPTSEAGTYSVAEDAEAGWDLSSATCDDGSDPGQIDLAYGETVTCTFTNTIQRGNIIVDKVTDPAGSAQSFDFTLTGTGVDLAFPLTDAATPYNSGDLLPTSENGTYNVAETLPAGWDLTSAVCSDGSPANAVDLAPGESVTCTFTNTIQRGEIIVEKVTDPDTSLVEFEFTTSYDLDPFMLGHGGQNNSGPLLPTSESSTYAATEALPAGWNLDSATCDDGSDPGAIDLGPGEVVTCTFTNSILRGNIVVEKQTLPDGSPEIFFFSSNFDGPFDLEDDEQYDSGDLLPSSEALTATYSVSEDATEGWDMTDATCTGSVSGAEDPAAIVLDPGETVTCVFENTQRASITIVKELLGLPDGEYCFNVFGPQLDDDFCIQTSGGTGSGGDDNLLPGLYSFTEMILGPYYPVTMDCDNGDKADAVDLGPGDDVTCTFVNVPVAPVPVNNTLALLILTLMLLATGWYFRPAGMRR